MIIDKFHINSNKLYKTKYKKLYKKLKPGHIILTANKLSLGYFFTKSQNNLEHTCFCIDKMKIVGMHLNGYTVESFKELCLRNTRIVILECIDFSNNYIETFIKEIKKYKNRSYNYQFDNNSENLSCIDLILKADIENRIKIFKKSKCNITGLYKVDCIYKASNIKVICDSDLM